MMRFTSRDPVRGKHKEPLSLHRYLYCGNAPTGFIDPSGASAIDYVKPLWPYISGYGGALFTGPISGSLITTSFTAIAAGPDLYRMLFAMITINNFVVENGLLDGDSYYGWLPNTVINLTPTLPEEEW